VILMPTGEAPHKRIEPEPGPKVRLELARLAAAGQELLEVSDLEVRRDGPSYTHLTLAALRELHPEAELFFLVGADIAADIERWEQPRKVLEQALLAVAPRPGASIDQVREALERLGAADRMVVVEMPEVDASSTEVRERVARGESVRELVPEAVAEAIAERGLYREAVRA
jgi:nicotinate-nucleotide adenylyltransferase